MKKDFGKIFGLILLSVMVLSILYLSLFTYKEKGKEEINMINIYGNNLLSKEIYMRFADMDQSSVYDDLNLTLLREELKNIHMLRKLK